MNTLVRMSVRPIMIAGDPVLATPAIPVTVFDAELAAFVEDLFDTNTAARGAGLAANQVGDPRAVFVYDLVDDGVRHRGYVINPVLETSEIPETMPDPEDDIKGCLSVPGEWFPTGRADWPGSAASTCPARPLRSRARATWPGACNTNPTISRAACICTG